MYNIDMQYEWDADKNEINMKKHGIDFSDDDLFEWNTALTILDNRINYGEPRYIAYGYVNNRLTVMVHTKCGDNVRIISWRKANEREKQHYG